MISPFISPRSAKTDPPTLDNPTLELILQLKFTRVKRLLERNNIGVPATFNPEIFQVILKLTGHTLVIGMGHSDHKYEQTLELWTCDGRLVDKEYM